MEFASSLPRKHRKRSYTVTHTSASSSDPPESQKSHRHHHSHHNIPRQHANQSQTSRIQPAATYDFSKQAGRTTDYTPASTANGSRRGSFTREESMREDVSIMPLAIARPEDLAKERQKIKARNYELRSSLEALSEHSMKITRDLDDGYYSCLEKLTVLQSTISTLQELLLLTRQLHGRFHEETGDLKTDMQQQMNVFGSFQAQKESIHTLNTRLIASKKKADGLSASLETARARVETLGAREEEWQTTVSRRIRLTWVIFGSVMAFIIAFFVFNSNKPMAATSILGNHTAVSSPTRTLSAIKESIGDVSRDSAASTCSSAVSDRIEPILEAGPEAEDSLRLSISTTVTTSSSSASDRAEPSLEASLGEDLRLRLFEEL